MTIKTPNKGTSICQWHRTMFEQDLGSVCVCWLRRGMLCTETNRVYCFHVEFFYATDSLHVIPEETLFSSGPWTDTNTITVALRQLCVICPKFCSGKGLSVQWSPGLLKPVHPVEAFGPGPALPPEDLAPHHSVHCIPAPLCVWKKEYESIHHYHTAHIKCTVIQE